jgi:hypothetical protein
MSSRRHKRRSDHAVETAAAPPPRFATSLAITALCGLVLAFYYRLWFPDLILIKRDAFRFFLPMKQYIAERLSAGELPQWFPYEGFGVPFLGNGGTGVFHPFTLLYFLLPGHDAYRVSVLLTILAAALGAFALGRILGLSRSGAVLSGIALAGSGYIVSMTENLLYLHSICLLPLFCAALEQALAKRLAWVAAPAVIWALVFLNGDVQTGYYYGFIALLWMAGRAAGSYKRAAIRLSVVIVLTVLLAGIELGPTSAIYLESYRRTPEFSAQTLLWSTHPLRLLTVVASPIGGAAEEWAVAHALFGGLPLDSPIRGLWAESLYLGVAVVGLALLGAWARRDLRVLAVLAGVALLLALGRSGGLYTVFMHVIPFWSAFRYPEKLMGVASFAAAMLAGAGLDALRAGQGRPWAWMGSAIAFAGLGLYLRSKGAEGMVASQFEAPGSLAGEVTTSASVACLFSGLAALGVGLMATGYRKGRLRGEIAVALLVVGVVADLARANAGAYHTAPAMLARFTPGLVEALQQSVGTLEPGRFRIFTVRTGPITVPDPVPPQLGFVGVDALLARQELDVEHNAQFHIENLREYMPGLTQASATLSVLAKNPEMCARFNVAYFIGARPHFETPQFAGSPEAFSLEAYNLILVRNPVPEKPRAYLSLRPERVFAPIYLSGLLDRRDFQSGEVDVIESPDLPLPAPAKPPGRRSAEIERYAPEEVVVRVTTPQAAVLVLLDSFVAGWRAVLDGGSEIPILRANGLVRAVVVPEGTHDVTFHYRTPFLLPGAVATVLGLVICLGLVAQQRWLRGREWSGELNAERFRA